jgi:hypothetical protein
MINIISAYLVICFTYVLYTQKHDEKIEKEDGLCPYRFGGGRGSRYFPSYVKYLPCDKLVNKTNTQNGTQFKI